MRLHLAWHVMPVAILAYCIPASAARAQAATEAGVVRDARTHKPLECQHVVLVDTAGHGAAHTVTDSAGQFALDAPHPGLYRVRFESLGWQSVVGPLDTLAEGDFKQRAYTIAFTNMFLPDTTRDTLYVPREKVRDFKEWNRLRLRAYEEAWKYQRQFDDSTVWQSRRFAPPNGRFVIYPERMFAAGIAGSVIAQFIVDSTGAPRTRSWQLVQATHHDFEKALTDALPRMQWKPARHAGAPVCELAQLYVRFELDGRDPRGDVMGIWFMNE